MKFSELKEQLDNGIKSNLYVFTGPEKEVLNMYVKKINEKPIRAKTFEEIIPRLTTKGLFSSTNTYVVEDDKTVVGMEYAEVKRLIGKNTVIFIFKEIDKRNKFIKQASKDIVEFQKFDENQLIWFVQKNIDIDEELAMMIAVYCGNDVARINNECHKLTLLGGEVTEEVIKDLIHPPVEDRIFDMIDLVAKRQPHEVFKLYYDLIELKESPIKIISLLYTKLKHVFLVQSNYQLQNAMLAGKTGLNFYQVNSARNLVGSFTVEELLEFMQMTQQAEVDIKTGMQDQYIAMESLLVNILK